MGKGKKVVGILALLVLLGAAVFVVYEAFKVREIVVEGCEDLSPDAVAALSGIEYEQSVFFLDKQAVMDALATEAFIKPVSVEIAYPDTVIVTIRERRRAACIEKDGAYLIIDNEGWLLEVSTSPQDIVYPLVYGLPADTVYIAQRIGTKDLLKLEVLSRVLDAVAVSGLEPKSVDVSLAAAIVMVMPDGLKIELGDDTALDSKLDWAAAFMEEEPETGGILDVSTVAITEKAYHRKN